VTNTLSVIDHAENHTYHQPTFEETDLNDPIAHCDLIDAARSYARVAQAADEAVEAARTSSTALVNSDIEAIEAFNVEWEAKAAHSRGPRNEAGFTAEVKSRTKGDLDAFKQAAEMASLRYQQYRAISLRAELNAEQATHAVDAAQARLVETARRLATREATREIVTA
jgi:hypothetical protein